MKRFLIPLAVLGAVLVAPGVVSAHTFTAEPTCDGLAWSAVNYQAGQTNSITVTIDGQVVYSDASFGSTDQGIRPWSSSVDHSWSIVVDAPGTQFDFSPSGVQHACQPTTTTEATTSSTTTTSLAPTTSSTPPPSSSPSSSQPAPPSSSPPSSSSPTDPTSTISLDQGTPPTTVCLEGQPCWDCSTMGNQMCGSLPPTGIDRDDTLFLAFALIAIGAVCILIGRRRP